MPHPFLDSGSFDTIDDLGFFYMIKALYLGRFVVFDAMCFHSITFRVSTYLDNAMVIL